VEPGHSGSDAEAANSGWITSSPTMPDAIAAEHVQVVKALWDSFADDAILADKASGRFYDPAKLRRVDHAGEHFRVAGPLQTGRPPKAPVVQAGSSEDGRRAAAATAVVFTAQQSRAAARAFAQGLKDKAQALGATACW
jgi:alkanesulfonate monooxygenase SsuD/methylene tetrahydromethanopterin reductase-like flavin-dependent oxidoreductase (luciferase family)